VNRAALIFALLGLLGCHAARPPMHPETPRGSWYVVSRGESLASIAKRAGVPPEDILEINGLARAEDVRPGRLIFLLAPENAPEPEPQSSGAPGRRLVEPACAGRS
jgi:hypothetical protein